MYTDEDLKRAVDEGIFTTESIEQFRRFVSKEKQAPAVDEENFKLISGFNDIFVVIACALLLVSSAWVTYAVHPAFSLGVVGVLSWGLAEFFVRKRKMALPAIGLLGAFVGSVFAAFVLLFDEPSENVFMMAAVGAGIATWFHWRRFRVPITVAAGVATVLTFILSLILAIQPGFKDYLMFIAFGGGIITFMVAMIWDSADRNRVTQKSDVAFWLHLLAAPMIVHPIFANLGILKGDASYTNIAAIGVLYVILTAISLMIDRRAFMVSALVYVLFALTTLFKKYGLAGDSFAFAGVFIGFSLLLLSGFWHKARYQLVKRLPIIVQKRLPVAE